MSSQSVKDTRKALKAPLIRIEKLENDLPQILQTVQQGFGIVDQKVRTVEEIVNALVSIIGLDKVQETVDANRNAQLQKESDAEEQGLNLAKDKGMIAVADEISDRSVIVGHEVDAEGKVLPPGRAQLLFAQVKEELRAELLGKKVGESIATPVGGQFIVDEIWDIVAKPPADEAAAKAVDEALGADLAPVAPAPVEAPATEAVTETASA